MSEHDEALGHAFISYVREDSDEADRLQELLEEAGILVWRDTRDLWPGEDWRAKIQQAIINMVNFRGAQFNGSTVGFSRAIWAGGSVDFNRAHFIDGVVDFGSGHFFGPGMVTFIGAHFSGGTVSFDGAQLSGSTIYFRTAQFSGTIVDFSGTKFTGSKVDFTDANWSVPPKLPIADSPPTGIILPAGAIQTADHLVHDYPAATHPPTEIVRLRMEAVSISSGPGPALVSPLKSVSPYPGSAAAVARIRVKLMFQKAISRAWGASLSRPNEKATPSTQADKIHALVEVAEAMATTDPDRATGLLRRAQKLVDHWPEMTGKKTPLFFYSELADARIYLVKALADRAKAQTDPDRTEQLFEDAEQLAHSIGRRKTIAASTDEILAIVAVAKAVAATDPDRSARLLADAERDARRQGDWKPEPLASVAAAVAATDPDRAARLFAEAQDAAQSITDANRKAFALTDVAKALATVHPDRAEDLAQSLDDDFLNKPSALTDVTAELAAIDPDRAERLAQSITSPLPKDEALTYVTAALAAIDSDRAERLAQSIRGESFSEHMKGAALTEVVVALAVIDPDRALRLARSITHSRSMIEAQRSVATALADTDPARSARLKADADRLGRETWDLAKELEYLAGKLEEASE